MTVTTVSTTSETKTTSSMTVTTVSTTSETKTTSSVTVTTVSTTSETKTTSSTTVTTASSTSDTKTTSTTTVTTASSTSDTKTTSSTTNTTGTTIVSSVTTVSETTPAPGSTGVVKGFARTFTPPTRVNYWSHDDRTFKQSGGLKDLAASITLYKWYVDDEMNILDQNGNKTGMKYGEVEEMPISLAFSVVTKDVSAFVHPEEIEDTPKKVWDNETKAALGVDDLTGLTDLECEHMNKYAVKCYFFGDEVDDPDFNLGEHVYLGEYKIYIGVKGDTDMENHVTLDDAVTTLQYYTNISLLHRTYYQLSEDPELDGPDGLAFYLSDVNYRKTSSPTSPLEDPKALTLDDALSILQHYTDEYLKKSPKTWEQIVGYDLLDSFYDVEY